MLLLGAEAHHVFHAGAVVPAAIEDHDFAGRREVLRGSAAYTSASFSRSDGAGSATTPENARAHALGNRPDGAAFAGCIAALEDDDDLLAGVLHPILKMAQLGLELTQLLLISLARDLDRGLALGFGDPVLGLLHGALLLVMPLSRVLQLWSRVVEEG